MGRVASGSPQRSNLVFFRVGNGSLHTRLLAEDTDRNWDCAVSWHVTPDADSAAEYNETFGSNKFDAFIDFFQKHSIAGKYAYIMLVDDDILFAPGDISRYFSICEQHQLYLSQPSLTWGTNSNHDVTLHNPVCLIRGVKFVEAMAPCFSDEALSRLTTTFRISRSVWGIDYAWASLLRGEGRLVVVDSVQILHTRPVSFSGGAFYAKLKAENVDPFVEYGKIKQSYPPFGSFKTERSGHRLRYPIPWGFRRLIVMLFEGIKKRMHKAKLESAPVSLGKGP